MVLDRDMFLSCFFPAGRPAGETKYFLFITNELSCNNIDNLEFLWNFIQ